MADEYSTIGDNGEVGFIDVPSVTTSTLTEEGPVMVSVSFPFDGGKPQSVLVNEIAVASFTIENTTDEYILLLGVKIYASIPKDSFVLSLMKPPSGHPDDIPEEDFVHSFHMEEQNWMPHGSLTICMSCVPKEIDVFTSIVHIQTDVVTIERLVFLLAEDVVSKALASQRPYNMPPQIRKSIEFEEIPEVVLQGLTEENYASYFNELLGMEELLIVEYVKAYNMKSVTLRQRYNQLVALKLSGLGERRSSIVRGDVVNVYGEYYLHQGLIHCVKADELLLQFNDEFYQRHINRNVYKICVVFNGTNFRKLHEAILSAEALHENFLFPHEYLSKRRITANNFVPISLLLDEDKKNVVHLILGCRGGAPYVIYGPPGTGKTKTLVEVILQLYTTRRNSHILVCASSNCAANHILEKILCEGMKLREEDIYRLNDTHRPLQKMNVALLRFYTYSAGFFNCPSRDALRWYKIIIMTYTSASYLYHAEGVNRGHFSHIILDDANQVSEPDTMIPISTLLEKNTVIVLCGDPKQLGHDIHSKQAEADGLGRSFLERLLDFEVYRSGDRNYVTMLLNNYRSHPAIVCVPSRQFYSGALIPYREDSNTSSLPWVDMLPNGNFPFMFCGIQGFDEREKGNPSWFNRIEASKVVELVQKLIIRNVYEQDIGIITHFPQQVLKIRKALMSLHMRDIEIGGVEQFLGKEKEVIILSTVRSTAKHDEYDRTFRMRYLSNPKRFNFALTRARSLLIIVGNPYIIEKD